MRMFRFKTVLMGLSVLALAGCSHHDQRASSSGRHHGFATASTDPFAGNGSPYYKGGAIPFGGGVYHVGSPYRVAGRWYTPREQPGYEVTGTASWYGEAFHRRKTANGEWFDMNTLTAASATLPLPSYALVTNLDNNRQVVVRINDRGPFVGDRVIDLSKKAADVLGYRLKGKTHVHVKLIGPAPRQDSMGHMMAMNQAMQNGASVHQLVAMAADPGARAPQTQMAMTKRLPPQTQKVAYSPPVTVASAYVVRVAVFHTLEEASAAYQQIVGQGPAQIIKAVGANGPLFRVQIGPLDTMAAAKAAMNSARDNGFEQATIVESQPLQISMK